MRRVALLLLMVLIAPVAAQSAEPTVTVSAGDQQLIVTREDDASTTFTVTFESDNPFDQLQPRELRIEHSAVPSGWSVQLSERVIQLSAGESDTITATVTLGANADDTEVPLTVTAKLVPRGAEGTPVGSQIDPESQGSAEITLKREDPLTREVLEGVGAWIWIVLGAAALLAIVLAIVLARNNKATIAMECTVKQATVAPGRSVAVPVQVENLSRNEDTVVFHVAPVGAGWAASLPVPELPLDGRRREELHLVVTSPKDAKVGEEMSIGLSANSARTPARVAELIVKVVVGATEAAKAAGDTTPADQQ